MVTYCCDGCCIWIIDHKKNLSSLDCTLLNIRMLFLSSSRPSIDNIFGIPNGCNIEYSYDLASNILDFIFVVDCEGLSILSFKSLIRI
jgi:hypothetical protein